MIGAVRSAVTRLGDDQGLFILSTQVALFRRDKQKSTALIVFPHIGVEVRHGTPFPGCVARAPLDE